MKRIRTPRERKSGAEGVALYAQLAATLRHQIAHGQWQVGDQLPSVAALAAEHGVAIVTVRQAIRILVEEGLLTSGRGIGTLLKALPPKPNDALRSAINDPLARQSELAIAILSESVVGEVPERLLAAGAPGVGPYVCLRKIHAHDGLPFCVMSIYLAEVVYRQLDRKSLRSQKINGLLIKNFRDDIQKMRTLVTISAADAEMSKLLQCAVGAPLANVVRCITDKRGQVVYAGEFQYVGERFILDFQSEIDMLVADSEERFPHVKTRRSASSQP
ncbi:GntR family transcriptional regulator [uncultured Alsobacter sp.]|uniref:GntR family transcriptional regulator n=1 Tax=uncultured Alsobacter sp. TaxID=1748258 RepID=UPI0025E74323|nr:GntR family transcriptional regulator [uncultured Alsobacter sp.]